MIKKPPHILITTPESLYLLITSQRGRELFRSIRYLIVDEIHAISNNKRGVHLSLSLKRLMALCGKEPVRIGLSATQKPLERIAAFLGGQLYNQTTKTYQSRKVNIIDCGLRKNLDVQVISPVSDFSNLPDATVWPHVIELLYRQILSHRSTLVFVNMRAQTEKIARQLNEKHRETGHPEALLALAHHGSISREVRYDIEDRLKKGDIPAVIATASLELGIDIGSIELVIQVAAPASVTSALQRVGRSGHLLKASSKGIIVPMYKADLDDAAALTRAIINGDIEETHIPENALDVLSQHIVAEVSMRDWHRQELYRLFRQSYCYRHLTETAFNNVVEMLSGRFSSTEMRALSPRLNWDRVNDMLLSRRGSRLTAVLNGGTIADRGYYGVYLEGTRTRLGEVEEEFVFESRVGDVFFLGNNEWRITEISRDRILVAPRSSTKPRAPFWKAEPLHRDFETSLKIGAFRRELMAGNGNNPSEQWPDACPADENTMNNTWNLLSRQRKHTDELPTDKTVVIEYFRDSAEEPHIVVHAPFGGRVLGAWATALALALEQRFHTQVQFTFDDDAILLRLLDTNELPSIDELLHMSAKEVEDRIVKALPNTPLFAVRFRHNSTRAFLLQRSQPNKRIPLWLQRLRSADLLQKVQQFPDFPVLLETYRDCLQDVFDIDSLKKVIQRIHDKSIHVHNVETSFPSPMASGVLFRFVFNHMYEYDQSRTPGHAAEISNEFLSDILNRESIPKIVPQNVAREMDDYWQYLSPERHAKDAEDVYEIIAALGPISLQQLQRRSDTDVQEAVNHLSAAGRIVFFKEAQGWITAEEKKIFQDNPQKHSVQKMLRAHAPVSVSHIAKETRFAEPQVKDFLQQFAGKKEIVHGHLVIGEQEDLWCDRENFRQLYRRAIAVRRKVDQPASSDLFFKFLMHWHDLIRTKDPETIFQRYAGYVFPVHVFERDVLQPRLLKSEQIDPLKVVTEEVSRGDVIPVAKTTDNSAQPAVRFLPRKQGGVILDAEDIQQSHDDLNETAQKIADFLKTNGASQYRDIADGTGLSPSQLNTGLAELVRAGCVSSDHYPSFLALLQSGGDPAEKPALQRQPSVPPQFHAPRSYSRRRRAAPRKPGQQKIPVYQGHWFLTTSFAVTGKTMQEDEQVLAQTRLLLQRYGILVKEFYRRESGLLPWHLIFRALKRLEWQGEIRRGYFIQGLSGLQFALPEAVDLLERLKMEPADSAEATPRLVSTVDPAMPFGGLIDWDLYDRNNKKVRVTRRPGNYILFMRTKPVCYCENFGARVFLLRDYADEQNNIIAKMLKHLLRLPAALRPRKKITINTIDNQSAASHPLAHSFRQNGFEDDSDGLVLWPSGV